MGGGDPAHRLPRHARFFRELAPARHGSLDLAQDGGGPAALQAGADPQDVLQGPLPASRRKRASEGRALGENLAGELDERRDVDTRRPVRRTSAAAVPETSRSRWPAAS